MIHEIIINSRCQLWFNKQGYLFYYPDAKVRPLDLQSWVNWKYHWPVYKRDGLVNKILDYYNHLPDHKRIDFPNECIF